MTLAQVVYSISTDEDFARQWRSDPDTALAGKGLQLSKEEQAFLTMGFRRYSPEDKTKMNLANIGFGLPWYP